MTYSKLKINLKMQKRNFNSDKKQNVVSNNKKQINRSSNKKDNNIPKDEHHSSIFSKEGLKTVIYKYNSIKSDNKTMTTDDQISKNTISRNKKEDIDKLSSLTKLKELNSHMDLILTGMKDKLDYNMNNDKKIFTADKFMNQIKNDNNNIGGDINDIYYMNKNMYNKKEQNPYYKNSYNDNYNYNNIYDKNKESSIKKFHNLRITNYNFSIIKKYLIYSKELGEEQQVKLKSIFNNDTYQKKKNKAHSSRARS